MRRRWCGASTPSFSTASLFTTAVSPTATPAVSSPRTRLVDRTVAALQQAAAMHQTATEEAKKRASSRHRKKKNSEGEAEYREAAADDGVAGATQAESRPCVEQRKGRNCPLLLHSTGGRGCTRRAAERNGEVCHRRVPPLVEGQGRGINGDLSFFEGVGWRKVFVFLTAKSKWRATSVPRLVASVVFSADGLSAGDSSCFASALYCGVTRRDRVAVLYLRC